MEHELEKSQMDSMKILAQTNVQISEAKNVLFKLQETETEYLVEREKKAMDMIQGFLESSAGLVQQIKNNHGEVQEFHRTVSEISSFISKVQVNILSLFEEFTKRSDVWDAEYARQLASLAEIKKELGVQSMQNKNDAAANKISLKLISEANAKIESRQSQIKSALEVLKQKSNG